MKTLVLSILISVITIGSGFAANPSTNKTSISTLKDAEAVHKHNMDMLRNQYNQAEAKIKASRGNHAELERERQYFIGMYQQDIDNGVRVAQSKEAIAEIDIRYAKLHAEREAYETNEIAKLQRQMEKAVKKEEKAFAKAKHALSKTTVAAR